VHAEGQFRLRQKWGRPVQPNSSSKLIRVELWEEKGADVNLASWMLYEGCSGAYDAAVVVSDDSDLLGPVRLIQERLLEEPTPADCHNRHWQDCEQAAAW
jgi:hypothetical protein